MSLKIKLTSPIHLTQQIYGSLKSSLGYALSVFIEFSKLRKVVSAGIAFVLAQEKNKNIYLMTLLFHNRELSPGEN